MEAPGRFRAASPVAAGEWCDGSSDFRVAQSLLLSQELFAQDEERAKKEKEAEERRAREAQKEAEERAKEARPICFRAALRALLEEKDQAEAAVDSLIKAEDGLGWAQREPKEEVDFRSVRLSTSQPEEWDLCSLREWQGCCNDVDAVEEALYRCCKMAAPPKKLLNASYDSTKSVLESAISSPDSHKCVFIFYAGHGVQSGKGTLLVPCDSKTSSSKGLIPVEWIRQTFRNSMPNGILILVLACCRRSAGEGIRSDDPLIMIPSARVTPRSSCDIILYACAPSSSTLDCEDFAPRYDMPKKRHSKLAVCLSRAMLRAHFQCLPVVKTLELAAQGCEESFQWRDGIPELVPRFQDESLKDNLYLAHPNANPGYLGIAKPISKASCRCVLPNGILDSIKGPIADFWRWQSANLEIRPQIKTFLQKTYELKEQNDWAAQMKYMQEVIAENQYKDGSNRFALPEREP
eukprot:Skav215297  [mRNA]  locus=scaffold6542:38064:43911:+ [translate_table: standard]